MSNNEIAAPVPTPCPECHSQRFVAEGVNSVRLVAPGTAVPGITGGFSELWAVVCPNCGYTSLYAKQPSRLIKHHGAHP